MRFLVGVKQVPDTAEMMVDANGSLVRDGADSVLNPYCEYALRKILDIKEEGDTVDVFTMGPPQAESALRRCLSLGADNAFLITDRAFAGADTWATARALTAFVQRFGCDADLIVFGRQSIDGDTGQVPYQVAQMLDLQQFAYSEDLRKYGDGFTVRQRYDDMTREVLIPRGSVVSFSGVDPNGAFPSIRGYLSAQVADVKIIDRVALGLGFYSVGLNGSMTRITRTNTVRSERRNRKVEVRDPSRGAALIMDELEAMR